MSLKVKCPSCLKSNELKYLESQIDEWDEENNVSCKECDNDFNLSAEYIGYEARDYFDVETYLKIRGLEIPKELSKFAVKCWLEQYFEEDSFLGGVNYVPESWKTEAWLKAREFALLAYSKREEIQNE